MRHTRGYREIPRITTFPTTLFHRRVACDPSYCSQSAAISTTARELASSLMMVAEVFSIKSMSIQLSSGNFAMRAFTL